MKKTLIILIFLALAIGVNAQANAYDGLHVGAKATKTGDSYIRRIDVNESDSTLKFYDKNGKLLNPVLNANGYLDNADYFVKLLQDTVSFTAETKTLALTDAGKIVYCSNADFQEITIPANNTVAFPVGTIITFINNGPGIVRLTPAATVVRKSVLDSTTMNTVNQTYQIIKRATNKWYFIGDFKD